VDRGPWTVDRGPWTVDRGPMTTPGSSPAPGPGSPDRSNPPGSPGYRVIFHAKKTKKRGPRRDASGRGGRARALFLSNIHQKF